MAVDASAVELNFSLLFQNYGKKPVMEKILPIAVQFLLHENKELSKNLSSYLSLAAIENSPLLAQHFSPIVESIVQHGKFSYIFNSKMR